tara:strand:+ start:125 stop:439 length:315 start_codon:yes stop_codon:yes gene_type:complete
MNTNMIVSNEYHIESDTYNWVLVKRHLSSKVNKKSGKYEMTEVRGYYGTLQQVVNKLVKMEVKGLDDLKAVVDSEARIAGLILDKITSDLRKGPYRLLKHGEQI